MALISCPKCGKQISSSAAACPHCGSGFVPEQPNVTAFERGGWGEQPPIRANYMPVIIGVIVAVLAVLAIIFLLNGTGDNPQNAVNNCASVPSGVYVPDSPEIANYNVTISVKCEKNSFMNKYDADILLDDKKLDTLMHGTSKDYSLTLSEGSHTIEFRMSGKHWHGADLYQKDKPETFQVMTLNVNEDTEVAYYIEMALNDKIKVSLQ
ncbi:MAG: zinc-ribbon domain-containing protein [Ruminococcaceae bacterium]|nr:zinc-ribbon domain-containing protein [Oscillospiraceae bacterium]